jgi:Zn-dependent peptidase ImmA (M78 family)
MTKIILGRFSGVTKKTRLYLNGIGVPIEESESNVLITIKMARGSADLIGLEREHYFAVGEAHCWPLERIDERGVLIIVRHRGKTRGITLPISDLTSISRYSGAHEETPSGEWRPSGILNECVVDETGVPMLAATHIENAAHDFLLEFGSTRLGVPEPTNLMGMVEKIRRGYGIEFDFSQALPNTASGKQILGMFEVKRRRILIDQSLQHKARFKFTLAHELGHLYLHAGLRLMADKIDGPCPRAHSDTRAEANLRRYPPRTGRDWLEWQANHFAGCILVPKATLGKAVRGLQEQLKVVSHPGIIYLDHQRTNILLYNSTITELLRIYQVSRTVLLIRLEQLGIVHRDPSYAARRVSELLRAA